MLYWAQNARPPEHAAASGGGSCRPAWRSRCSAPALALLNFGIDEFINPRLRAAGLTGRQARRAGAAAQAAGSGLRPVTAVAEQAALAA